MTSIDDNTFVSTSLDVLTSPVPVNGLKFEDLLQAPTELMGRGKHGSLYKVILDDSLTLDVKRIKDWGITSDEFKKRMLRIDQAKHANVLPVIGFYSSKHEKLLVYEYQQNGCLFNLLHETNGAFDWVSRLNIESKIAEALAYMHQSLHEEGIAHWKLEILKHLAQHQHGAFCLSEFGLMVIMDHDQTKSKSNPFDLDIYGFGIILLELLTGKLVENDGVELTKWVHSVVREEWTVEVFDKYLILEGASTERMVNLLQVALKCIDQSSEARPSANQVVTMINSIKEEEERSVASKVLEA